MHAQVYLACAQAVLRNAHPQLRFAHPQLRLSSSSSSPKTEVENALVNIPMWDYLYLSRSQFAEVVACLAH